MSKSDSTSNPMREILDSYYRAWFRYHPEAAVDCGVDGYAHLLTPCDEESAGAIVCLNDELLVALEEFEGRRFLSMRRWTCCSSARRPV